VNSYQRRKARIIVNLLVASQAQSSLSHFELAKVIAHMSPDQWRTICLTAGVPIADLPAKEAVLEMVRAKAPRVAR
jgi:hypothetical protein